MKIENSNINMASSHTSFSSIYAERATIEARISDNQINAIVELSQEGSLSYKESLDAIKKQDKDNQQQQKQQNWQNTLNQMKQQENANKLSSEKAQSRLSNDLDGKIKMLRKMLELLNGKKNKYWDISEFNDLKMLSESSSNSTMCIGISNMPAGSVLPQTTSRSTVWQRISVESGSVSEVENTSFASKGIVQTSDGRSIDFNIEVTMGRAMTYKYDKISASSYIVTDPLIINMDSNVTSVSDQKFKFDLDCDGKEENISFASMGSGFLALDKNEDGIINDGSELFGTKSGDGFKDLAAYDSDGNGWIDENDDVFSKLKVWTKDENGNDSIIDLKQADVGAIYLGNTNTEFTQKDMNGNAHGIIRNTGIYLKESTGAASTIAHVDLVL